MPLHCESQITGPGCHVKNPGRLQIRDHASGLPPPENIRPCTQEVIGQDILIRDPGKGPPDILRILTSSGNGFGHQSET